eukprot:scaffold8986_cov101-Skeletonema_marinoi.AAC.1
MDHYKFIIALFKALVMICCYSGVDNAIQLCKCGNDSSEMAMILLAYVHSKMAKRSLDELLTSLELVAKEEVLYKRLPTK